MKIILGLFFILISFQTQAQAQSCADCEKLKKIHQEYQQEAKKKKPNYNSLQLKASEIIEPWRLQKTKPSPEQISSYVQILRVAVPADPGRAILENTVEFLQIHQVLIRKEISKLPVSEAIVLLDAIEVSLAGLKGSNGP